MPSLLLNLLVSSVFLASIGMPGLKTFTQKLPNTEFSLMESGRARNVSPARSSPSEVKLISYNIRWRNGDELREMIELLKHDQEIGGAQIIGLQEVDRNKKRTGNTNTARLIADELGMYYAWAAPPVAKREQEEETGVSILSSYPISDVRRLVLAHEGPGGRRRVAIGATLTIAGSLVRVYSVHAETRISVTKKMEQLKTVLQDLESYPKGLAAIVLGDFNTWQPIVVKKTTQLFVAEKFTTPFPNDRETFMQRILGVPISLKLDWIWLRGLEASSYGIDEKICLSDHWPLWTVIKIKPAGPHSKNN